MPIGELKTRISQLPEQPGVYLFFAADGETIYVGKARSLRDRVRSYLSGGGTSPKTDALLAEVAHLEVILTDSVVEALALENQLIKQRSPRYNILLRDDKEYPYLRLTTSEAFPRLLVARRVERDGDVYAGPFLPASLARRTMALAHRTFGIRSCNEHITGQRGRPCLEYDIKRCLAPCVDTICTRDQYARAVEDARLFLAGRNEELAGILRARMLEAAAAERFEAAAQLRDAVRTIEALGMRQKMAAATLGDRDGFGLAVGPHGAVVVVFQVRRGRVIDRVELTSESAGATVDGAEILQAAVAQFYEDREVPPDLYLPIAPAEADILTAWLTRRAGRRVRLIVPRRGDRRDLVALATRNAALAYRSRFAGGTADEAALEELGRALALPSRPRRIEGFDVSTIQGRDTVASLVVAEEGRMRPSEYRTYRVRATGREGRGPDDLTAMREVVGRRYRRVLEHGGPFPDLILVDGGAAQLAAAYDALGQIGLANLVAIGLAKREEQVYVRDRADPIGLAASSPALRLLQRVRDEAHRVAVGYHRRARTRRDLTSVLEEIPGIGPRRRRMLLTRFGSLAGVRRASRSELVAVVGSRTADAVRAYFDRTDMLRL